jgi:hypothetical protein
MDRLCQDVKLMSPLTSVFQHVGGPVVSGHEKHFAFGKNFADFDGRVNACHFGHYNVGDEHIERSGFCSVNRLRPTVSGRGIEPKHIQNLSEGIGYKLLIFHDKNIQFAGSPT